MPILIQDYLDDAIGTDIFSRPSTIGGTPIKHPSFNTGAFVAVSGEAYPAGVGATVVRWSGVYGNCEIEASGNLRSHVSDSYLGVAVGMDPTLVTWHVAAVCPQISNSTYDSFAYTTGSGGIYLDAAKGSGLYLGPHTVKISNRNGFIQGWIDRREFVRAQNDGLPSGSMGLVFGAPQTYSTGPHATSVVGNNDFNRTQIQFVGDSYTHGIVTGPGPTYFVLPKNEQWVQILSNRLAASGIDFDWSNLGVGGRQIDQMITSASEVKGVNGIIGDGSVSSTNFGFGCDFSRRPNAAKDIIVFQGGINDIAASVSSGAVVSRIQTFVSGRRAAGFSVIIQTIPYCDEASTSIPDGFNLVASGVNSWIRSNSNQFDGIIDIYSDPVLNDLSVRNQYDLVHLTPSGNIRLANLAFPVVYNLFQEQTASDASAITLINPSSVTRNGSVSVFTGGRGAGQRKNREINTQIDITSENDRMGNRLNDPRYYWTGENGQ